MFLDDKHIYNQRIQNPYKKKNGAGAKKFLALLVSFFLYLIKVTSSLSKVLFSFALTFIYRPIRKMLSLGFYKLLVPLYSFYLSIAKKLGISGLENKFRFTLNQRSIHFMVIFMTIFLLLVNLNTKNKASASGFVERAHSTMLANLVTSEFDAAEDEDQLIMETFDKQAIVTSAQLSYLDNLSNMRAPAKVSLKDEEEDIYDSSQVGSIVNPNITTTKITEQDRTEVISYEVASGDTISTIAEDFGISVSTILWENKLSSYSIIRPGDELDILPMTGINHNIAKNETVSSIAKKYDVEDDVILKANKLALEDSLKVGAKLLVPGGKKEIYRAPTAPKTYTGFTAIKNIVTTPSSETVSSNKMAWPTVGHRITQYYSWRHHGLDIADKVGTALYAADSGTVEYAGWGTGYGNQIVINHGGGKKTRYAHMNKFYVKKGDKVSKGQTLGEMGNTGWSTGPHIHFEVIINGKKYNPLNYIK